MIYKFTSLLLLLGVVALFGFVFSSFFKEAYFSFFALLFRKAINKFKWLFESHYLRSPFLCSESQKELNSMFVTEDILYLLVRLSQNN